MIVLATAATMKPVIPDQSVVEGPFPDPVRSLVERLADGEHRRLRLERRE